MPLTIGALKYAVERPGATDHAAYYAVAESTNVHGLYAQYEGDGFSLSVDLADTGRVYLHLTNPAENYRVLTGPLRDFAAMLTEYHLTDREEN